MLDSYSRKDDHIKHSQEQFKETSTSFNDIKIVHNSLGKVDLDEVDISTNILNYKSPLPFYINAMTGGSEKSLEINKSLAIIARENNLMMATGSISSALRNEASIPSFKIVRKVNPKGFIMANIGAEQSLDNAKKAIDLIDANALQIHLNVPEELVMPEGDRKFKTYKDSLYNLVENIDLPIIVKEVGFGMSKETISELYRLGVNHIDISGTGGTNFIQVENARRQNQEFDYLADFGQSTLISLLESQDYIDKLNIIASGGIKNPYDVVKCLSLGAKACGMSAYYLNQAINYDLDFAITNVQNFASELKILFTIFNAKNISDLRRLNLVLTGLSKEWCEARNIDYIKLANRSLRI